MAVVAFDNEKTGLFHPGMKPDQDPRVGGTISDTQCSRWTGIAPSSYRYGLAGTNWKLRLVPITIILFVWAAYNFVPHSFSFGYSSGLQNGDDGKMLDFSQVTQFLVLTPSSTDINLD